MIEALNRFSPTASSGLKVDTDLIRLRSRHQSDKIENSPHLEDRSSLSNRAEYRQLAYIRYCFMGTFVLPIHLERVQSYRNHIRVASSPLDLPL